MQQKTININALGAQKLNPEQREDLRLLKLLFEQKKNISRFSNKPKNPNDLVIMDNGVQKQLILTHAIIKEEDRKWHVLSENGKETGVVFGVDKLVVPEVKKDTLVLSAGDDDEMEIPIEQAEEVDEVEFAQQQWGGKETAEFDKKVEELIGKISILTEAIKKASENSQGQGPDVIKDLHEVRGKLDLQISHLRFLKLKNLDQKLTAQEFNKQYDNLYRETTNILADKRYIFALWGVKRLVNNFLGVVEQLPEVSLALKEGIRVQPATSSTVAMKVKAPEKLVEQKLASKEVVNKKAKAQMQIEKLVEAIEGMQKDLDKLEKDTAGNLQEIHEKLQLQIKALKNLELSGLPVVQYNKKYIDLFKEVKNILIDEKYADALFPIGKQVQKIVDPEFRRSAWRKARAEQDTTIYQKAGFTKQKTYGAVEEAAQIKIPEKYPGRSNAVDLVSKYKEFFKGPFNRREFFQEWARQHQGIWPLSEQLASALKFDKPGGNLDSSELISFRDALNTDDPKEFKKNMGLVFDANPALFKVMSNLYEYKERIQTKGVPGGNRRIDPTIAAMNEYLRLSKFPPERLENATQRLKAKAEKLKDKTERYRAEAEKRKAMTKSYAPPAPLHKQVEQLSAPPAPKRESRKFSKEKGKSINTKLSRQQKDEDLKI